MEKEIVDGLDSWALTFLLWFLSLSLFGKNGNSLNVAPCICNLILLKATFLEVCTLEKKLLMLVRAVAILNPEYVRDMTGFLSEHFSG